MVLKDVITFSSKLIWKSKITRIRQKVLFETEKINGLQFGGFVIIKDR